MEDYPILGISSAEDRTQLLRLGQMLKSLDLWSDSDANHHAVGDGLTHCSCLAPDEDVCDLSGVGERLDFSGKTFSHHQKLCCYPAHVHVSARPDRSAQAGSGEIRTEKNRRKTLERKTDTIAVYDPGTAGYNYGLPLSSPPVPNKRWVSGASQLLCYLFHPPKLLYETNLLFLPPDKRQIVFISTAIPLVDWREQHLLPLCDCSVWNAGNRGSSGSACVWGKDLWLPPSAGEEKQMLWQLWAKCVWLWRKEKRQWTSPSMFYRYIYCLHADLSSEGNHVSNQVKRLNQISSV